jgi:hypothetical protein
MPHWARICGNVLCQCTAALFLRQYAVPTYYVKVLRQCTTAAMFLWKFNEALCCGNVLRQCTAAMSCANVLHQNCDAVFRCTSCLYVQQGVGNSESMYSMIIPFSISLPHHTCFTRPLFQPVSGCYTRAELIQPPIQLKYCANVPVPLQSDRLLNTTHFPILWAEVERQTCKLALTRKKEPPPHQRAAHCLHKHP